MSLRHHFRSFFQTASIRADSGGLGVIGGLSPDNDIYYGLGGGQRSTAGPMVSPASATRLSAVFACARVVSETKGSLPIMVYRERKSGGREPAKDHPAMELFQAPNPWQTWMDYYETISVHEELRGNAYALKLPANGRAIGQLLPIHPDRVRVYLLPNNRLRYEVTQYLSGKIDVYTQDEIVHYRGLFSYNGIMGVSTVAAMAETIGVGLAQQEFRGRSFHRPFPGVTVTGPQLKDDARELMKQTLAEGLNGENSFGALIVPPGYEVNAISLTNKDQQLIEASNASRIDICAGYRVPPHKIGDLSRGTFSNIEQQNIEFATDTVRPRVVRDELRTNRDIIDALRANESAAGDYYTVIDLDALYRGDLKSRYEAYAAAMPWMLRNEMRAREGFNAVDGLDEPIIAVNMETVDQAERRSQASANAANASAEASRNSGNDGSGENDDQEELDRSGGGAETPGEDQDEDEKQKAAFRQVDPRLQSGAAQQPSAIGKIFRSGNTRARIEGIVYSAAERIVRREVKALTRLAQKANGPEGKGDGPAIEGEIQTFYLDLAPLVVDTMKISTSDAHRYCAAHAARVSTAKAALLDLEVRAIEEDGARELVGFVKGFPVTAVSPQPSAIR